MMGGEETKIRDEEGECSEGQTKKAVGESRRMAR